MDIIGPFGKMDQGKKEWRQRKGIGWAGEILPVMAGKFTR
jgi:hypothetical protein